RGWRRARRPRRRSKPTSARRRVLRGRRWQRPARRSWCWACEQRRQSAEVVTFDAQSQWCSLINMACCQWDVPKSREFGRRGVPTAGKHSTKSLTLHCGGGERSRKIWFNAVVGKIMDRRTFLKTAAGAGALATGSILAAPAISQRAAARTLRLVPHADL